MIRNLCLVFMLGIMPLQSIWANNNDEALIEAVMEGNLKQVKSLIEQGANVNAKSKELGGITALMSASGAGNLEMVKYLISKGADVNAESKWEVMGFSTALMWALMGEHLEVATYLISKGADIKNNTFPLIWASMEGKLEIVKYLVSKGADINAESKELGGITALMATLINKHWEVAKYLVSKGANVNARFQKFNNATILMFASGTGNLEMVQYLIIKGADINAKDNNGKTALMEASLEGNLEIVKYLVSQGAYINAISTKDMYSMTALDFAEIAENYDVAEFLREAGAKSLLNGTQFAVMRKDFQVSKIESKVATARSNIASVQKAIVAKVFADNINTKSPKAPKGESWGKWIIEVGGLDTDRWAVSSNGIYLKDCNNKTQLIWINHKMGSMHFNPSKLNGDNEFCIALKESYTLGENNGDKIVPLVSNDEVEF